MNAASEPDRDCPLCPRLHDFIADWRQREPSWFNAPVPTFLPPEGDGAVELLIVDDGVGFDPDAPYPGHYGVTGLREQAQLIGAELDLHSEPGAGVRLRLRLRVGPEMRMGSEDGHEPQPLHVQGSELS